jgi:hypothetical protein
LEHFQWILPHSLREKEQEPVLELERVVVQEGNKPWDEEPNLHN